MAIGFGFKWNMSLSQGITRIIIFRIDLLCLHLDNSELNWFYQPEDTQTHINFKTPLMKIEKVVLRNEGLDHYFTDNMFLPSLRDPYD